MESESVFGSNQPGKPVSIAHFMAICLLLFGLLVVTETWEYFDLKRHATAGARQNALKNAEYLENAIIKLVLSSDSGGKAIDKYVNALNAKDQYRVRLVRSEAITLQYGEVEGKLPVNDVERNVLLDGKPQTWETSESFIFIRPLMVVKQCQACHLRPNVEQKPFSVAGNPIPLGYVLGLLEITHPKEALIHTQAGLLMNALRGIGLIIVLLLIFGYGFYKLITVLRESEQRITAIIKTVGEGIIVIDDNAHIRFLNQELCAIFGYPEEELIGKDVKILMPEKYRDRHTQGMKRYTETGETKIMGNRIELEGRRKDGTLFPLELRLEETKAGNAGRFITAAIREITDRKRAEAELERSSQILVQAQESERKRIASELHDGLGQNLLIIKNGIRKCIKTLSDTNRSEDILDQIASISQESIEEIRRITYHLRPHQLDKLGLKGAIESAINRAESSSALKFESDIHEIDGILKKDHEIHLYRIVQEGLRNIIQYANAENVTVNIGKTGDGLDVTITDNGKGFDIESVRSNGKGLGLLDISERVKILNGTLKIESDIGGGTTISVSIPADQEVEDR